MMWADPECGNSPKPEDKWKIRQALHPQLAELWEKNPILHRLKVSAHIPPGGNYFSLERHHRVMPSTSNMLPDSKYLLEPIPIGNIKFIPLVRESMALVCSLDITFLRKEEPGALIKRAAISIIELKRCLTVCAGEMLDAMCHEAPSFVSRGCHTPASPTAFVY
jgi:hypothetical protein